MTIAQIDQLITENLADYSNILPEKHRAISSALLAYISTMPKLKVLTLETIPSADRHYSIPTLLETNEIITGAYAMLECKVANNGFSVGDIVTAPTPSPEDEGRTAAQGIGLQYSNIDKANVKVLINDAIWIMMPFSAVANSLATTLQITATISNWKLKVFLTYI